MPLNMFSKVEEIKGVGPKTREIMERAGIVTVRDLLYYLPRTYENYTNKQKLIIFDADNKSDVISRNSTYYQ